MITIVSKDKEKVQFDQRIVEFAKNLQIYDQEQEIVFDDIITGEFLKAMKQFYESCEFNVDKLKIKINYIKSNNLEQNLKPEHLEIMLKFYQKAQSLKTIIPFVELIQGADMLRASHFKDLICCTIATFLYCQGNSEFDIKKYRENWNLGQKDAIFPHSYNSNQFYQKFSKLLSQNYQCKLDHIFNLDGDSKGKNEKQDKNDTLGKIIEQQIGLGYEEVEEEE